MLLFSASNEKVEYHILINYFFAEPTLSTRLFKATSEQNPLELF